LCNTQYFHTICRDMQLNNTYKMHFSTARMVMWTLHNIAIYLHWKYGSNRVHLPAISSSLWIEYRTCISTVIELSFGSFTKIFMFIFNFMKPLFCDAIFCSFLDAIDIYTGQSDFIYREKSVLNCGKIKGLSQSE
jgi:hypothetical protein